MARDEVIPHDIERNRGDPAGFRAEPLFGFFYFRQVVGHDVDPAVHKNAFHYVSGVILGGIATHKIGQQIAGKRAVSEMGEVQVSEKIHAIRYPVSASCCSKEV